MSPVHDGPVPGVLRTVRRVREVRDDLDLTGGLPDRQLDVHLPNLDEPVLTRPAGGPALGAGSAPGPGRADRNDVPAQ